MALVRMISTEISTESGMQGGTWPVAGALTRGDSLVACSLVRDDAQGVETASIVHENVHEDDHFPVHERPGNRAFHSKIIGLMTEAGT